MCRVFHRIEVVQVTKEFVEAVNGRQEFVSVAQVVLAELAGRVALRFQGSGNGHSLSGQAGWCTRLANGSHTGADG